MCEGCYEDFGRPQVRSARVRRLRDKIERVFEMNYVGGNLHIQLDDWNIEDEHFAEPEMKVWDDDTSPERLAIERDCYAAMRRATLEQRASALGLYDGFWSLKPAQPEDIA